MVVNPIIIEPDTPQWWKRAVLSIANSFIQAGRPAQMQGYATTDLPDPAKWRGCIAYDLTADTFVGSNGVTWNAL